MADQHFWDFLEKTASDFFLISDKITLNHIAILSYFDRYFREKPVEVLNGQMWAEVDWQAMIKNMPILGITSRMAFVSYFKLFKEIGLIEQSIENKKLAKSYYRLTPLCKLLLTGGCIETKNNESTTNLAVTEIKEKEIEPQKEKKQINTKETHPCFATMRKIFEYYYQNNIGEAYYWEVKDAKALNQIIKKLTYSYLRKWKTEAKEENILNGFQLILDNLPDWYKQRISLTMINSQYKNIISEIVSKFKPQKNPKNGKHYHTTGSAII